MRLLVSRVSPIQVAICVWALLHAPALLAQCPDGSPPPCASPRPAPSPAPRVMPELRRLTSTGRVGAARLSQDGRLLAYADSNVLYVSTMVAGARPVEISREPWRFGRLIRWFPDGTRLLTLGDSGWFILPALGGTPSRLTSWAPLYASISPDGQQVLVSQSGEFSQVHSVATRSIRTLDIRGGDRFAWEHVWSPDGRTVAVVTFDGRGRYKLQAISLASGESRVILQDSIALGSPHWDASTGSIVYFRGTAVGGQVWRQLVSPSGAAIGAPRLVMAPFDGPGFQLVDGGQHLAYPKVETISNYVMGGTGDDTTSVRVTRDATAKPTRGAVFSPDGRSIAFVGVDGSGGHNLHLLRLDSNTVRQLTYLSDRFIWRVVWAPDGRRIGYCSIGTAQTGPAIGIVTVDAGEPIAVPTHDLSTGCGFAWASNEDILYQLAGNRDFTRRSLASGSEKRLVGDSTGFTFDPVLHVGTGRIAYYWNSRAAGTWVIGGRDTVRRRIADPSLPIRFSGDGSFLYVANVPARRQLTRLRVDGMGAEAIRTPRDCQLTDVLPDGSRVLCHVTESTRRDIWMIRNFDPDRPAARP